MSLVLYHNPRCSKSRALLARLEERGADVEIVEYLAHPPTRADLERLLAALPDPPGALVRNDKRFAELGLDPGDYTTAEEVIGLLLAHPDLMQRPILIAGGKAAIGRPAEQALALLP
jgi:arsenate reductase